MSKENALQKKQVSYGNGVVVFLFAILANLLAQLLVQIVGSSIGNAVGKDLFASDYFQLVCMLIFQLAFISVPIIYCKCVKKFRPQLLAPIAKPAPEVFLSIALPVITILGFFLPAQYFSLGLNKIGYNLSSEVKLNTAGKFVLGIIVMCVAAPFVEELIFRGFLLSGLRTVYNDYAAAALCATAFSLMHMNPDQTIYQFFLGYTCALAAINCRNLIGPMIIHSLSNLIAVLLYIPALNDLVGTAFIKLSGNIAAAVIVTVVLAVGAGVAIFFICRAMNKLRSKREIPQVADGEEEATQREEQEVQKTADNKFATILYCAAIGLCALTWILVFVAGMITLPTV